MQGKGWGLIMTTNHTLKTDVRSLLKYGRENAVTGKELAKTLGYPNDRVIRQAIRELIADSVPIAASTINPCGYFITKNEEEATKYLAVLRGRLVEDAYRRRDYKLASRVILDPYQIQMAL